MEDSNEQENHCLSFLKFNFICYVVYLVDKNKGPKGPTNRVRRGGPRYGER